MRSNLKHTTRCFHWQPIASIYMIPKEIKRSSNVLWSRKMSMKLSSALELVRTISGSACSRTEQQIRVNYKEPLMQSDSTHFGQVKMGAFLCVLEDIDPACHRIIICTSNVSAACHILLKRWNISCEPRYTLLTRCCKTCLLRMVNKATK
jgi:hypothetical protein